MLVIIFLCRDTTFFANDAPWCNVEPNNPFIQDLLRRKGVDPNYHYQYNEVACEIGEQLVCLGKGEDDPPPMRMLPLTPQNFGSGFYQREKLKIII